MNEKAGPASACIPKSDTVFCIWQCRNDRKIIGYAAKVDCFPTADVPCFADLLADLLAALSLIPDARISAFSRVIVGQQQSPFYLEFIISDQAA